MNRILKSIGAMSLFATFNFLSIATFAQGTTAFTYQGRMSDNGTNANGTYTMIFALYDSLTNGNVIGGPITNTTTLANGLFTVNLDFGAGAFNGGSCWLDISVTNGTGTQDLSPRQPVTPVPYALYASTSGTGMGGSNATVTAGTIQATNLVLTGGGSTWNFNINSNGTLTIGDEDEISFGSVIESFLPFESHGLFTALGGALISGSGLDIGNWNLAEDPEAFGGRGSGLKFSFQLNAGWTPFVLPQANVPIPNTQIPMAGVFSGGISVNAIAFPDGSGWLISPGSYQGYTGLLTFSLNGHYQMIVVPSGILDGYGDMTYNGIYIPNNVDCDSDVNAGNNMNCGGTVFAGNFVVNGAGSGGPTRAATSLQTQDILSQVNQLNISTWHSIKGARSTYHLCPNPNQFNALFGFENKTNTISLADESGVALAAIQGLNQKLEADNAKLKQENTLLGKRLDELETEVKILAQKNR